MSSRASAVSLLPGIEQDLDLPRQGEWGYADYCRLPDDGWRYEVLRGELLMSPAPSVKHQGVVRNLAFLFLLYLRQSPLGEILFAPVDVILPDSLGTPVQPDLIFIRRDRLHVIQENCVEGAPDLIVEVLSPSNWFTDRRTKFALYAEAGVREYWLVEPRDRSIEVFILRHGRYEQLGKFLSGETVRSEVLPGFSPTIDEVFAS